MASVGPVPFCGMILERLGASVVIIDRPQRSDGRSSPRLDPLRCGRPNIELDLTAAEHRTRFFSLIKTTDVLVEGMRPGVMERLGVGPTVLPRPASHLGPRVGMGSSRTARRSRATTSISGRGRSAVDDRRAQPATCPAPEPGRRLRRRPMFLVAEILAALLRRERRAAAERSRYPSTRRPRS